VGRRKASGPSTDSVNGPRAVSQAGELKNREATPHKSEPQAADRDRLIRVLERNAALATGEMRTRLLAAIERLHGVAS
jgi:hypothetical protein